MRTASLRCTLKLPTTKSASARGESWAKREGQFAQSDGGYVTVITGGAATFARKLHTTLVGRMAQSFTRISVKYIRTHNVIQGVIYRKTAGLLSANQVGAHRKAS